MGTPQQSDKSVDIRRFSDSWLLVMLVTRILQKTIFVPSWIDSVMRQWILCTSPNHQIT